jgi:hypothetical protein
MHSFAENQSEMVLNQAQLAAMGGGGDTYHFHEGAIVINGTNMTAAQIFDAFKKEADWRKRGHG